MRGITKTYKNTMADLPSNFLNLPDDFYLLHAAEANPLSRLLLPAADRKSREIRRKQLNAIRKNCNIFHPGKLIFRDNRCPSGCCVLTADTVKTTEDQTNLLHWFHSLTKQNERFIYLNEDDLHLTTKLQIIEKFFDTYF